MQEQVADEGTRTQVIEGLESALRDDVRPDLPSWLGQPNVMFEESDPIPRALGWSAPTTTEADFDEKRATFLGNLACGDDGGAALVQGIARRAASPLVWRPFDERDRPLYRQLAQRLTPDDPQACPAAAALPEDLRAQLEQIADRRERPPFDQAKPEPAPPDAPSELSRPSPLR